MRIPIALKVAAAAVSLCTSWNCVDSSNAQVPAGKPGASRPQTLSDGGDGLRIVTHEEILPAGFPQAGRPVALRNPYAGNKNAVTTGGKLFISNNCIDCHGADGAGAMGPSFQDGRWHFGGSESAVFESIYQGRPDGMPSWGGRIANDQIWMLTAYVRSLATADISTENFKGLTIERTGH